MSESTPPVLFGKYRLLRKIAQGGMAEIFLAKATGAGGFEKLVVVKRILPKLAAHEKFVRMFINEAKVNSALSHSNVVQIFDFGRIGSDYFIAMEHVDGRDLRTIIRACRDRGRKIPIEFVLYTGIQIAKALQYAHTRTDAEGKPLEMVHRDVSPQNVIVSRQGEVKLTDFGIAKATGTLSETVANEIKGNFGYMPPEQARGEALDPRTDVYASAMVLYEMATMKNPFADSNLLTVIERIKTMPPPPPSHYNPQMSKSLDATLLKALEKDAAKRHPSAGALLAELSEELFPTSAELVQHSMASFLDSLFPPDAPPSKVTGAVPAVPPEKKKAPAPKEDAEEAEGIARMPPASRVGPLPRGLVVDADDTDPSGDKPAAKSGPPPMLPDTDARFARKIRDLANMGRLRLDCAPTHVEVFIDAQKVTVGAPIEIQTSAKVEHVLELKADGFDDFATTFTLDPGETRDMQIVLAEAAKGRAN